MRTAILALVAALWSLPALAATKADAEAALDAAAKLEAQTDPGNRWLPAEAAMKAAKAAMAKGDWDQATAAAARARELISTSIEQSKEQETAWQDAVLR